MDELPPGLVRVECQKCGAVQVRTSAPTRCRDCTAPLDLVPFSGTSKPPETMRVECQKCGAAQNRTTADARCRECTAPLFPAPVHAPTNLVPPPAVPEKYRRETVGGRPPPTGYR